MHYNSQSVNSSIAEGLHTCIMVQARVDTVNSDSVDPQVLQEWEISGACIWEGQWVDEGRRLAEIIVGALNHNT